MRNTFLAVAAEGRLTNIYLGCSPCQSLVLSGSLQGPKEELSQSQWLGFSDPGRSEALATRLGWAQVGYSGISSLRHYQEQMSMIYLAFSGLPCTIYSKALNTPATSYFFWTWWVTLPIILSLNSQNELFATHSLCQYPTLAVLHNWNPASRLCFLPSHTS